jgi:hypothetical protein
MYEKHGFLTLIRRVRAGDHTAAAELVKRYLPAVRRVIRLQLRDSPLRRVLDSMDVCQGVLASFFIRAASGQYELDRPGQLVRLLPQSGSWLPYWESQAFPISVQEMSLIVRRSAKLEQLGTAAVTADTVELGGQTALLLGFQFGSSVTIDLVIGWEVAGSPTGHGSAAESPPAVVGGVVDVYSDTGERRFLMHN